MRGAAALVRARQTALLRAVAASLALGCADAGEDAPSPAARGGWPFEAGFVEIEPVDYRIAHDTSLPDLRAGRARLFWTFQPARHDPASAPLALLFNGRPGATSAILLGLGASDRVVSGGSVRDDPAGWTRSRTSCSSMRA